MSGSGLVRKDPGDEGGVDGFSHDQAPVQHHRGQDGEQQPNIDRGTDLASFAGTLQYAGHEFDARGQKARVNR